MCGDSLIVKPHGDRMPARVTADDLLDLYLLYKADVGDKDDVGAGGRAGG